MNPRRRRHQRIRRRARARKRDWAERYIGILALEGGALRELAAFLEHVAEERAAMVASMALPADIVNAPPSSSTALRVLYGAQAFHPADQQLSSGRGHADGRR